MEPDATSSSTLTRRFLAAAEPSRSPAPVQSAGRAFFDFLTCVRAGRQAGADWPGDAPGRLAIAAHALDRDDLHHASLTHPGGVVWSAICGTARGRATSLKDALVAGAYGYEVMTRLATALGPEHRRYWHVTATSGVVGAAVASGVVLGLEGDDLESAAGHAISVVGGSIRVIVELSGTRLFHRAHAASTGVAAARAAAAGVAATRLGLEAPNGLFAAAAGGGFPERLFADVQPAIELTGVRVYGASGFAYGAIEAAASIGPLSPEAIASVVATVSPAAAGFASNAAPLGDDEAWWSVEHAVAVCLASGDPAALEAGLSVDPAIRDLARRVTLRVGEGGWGAQVEAALGDGTTLVGSCLDPLGLPARPVSDEQRLAKWELLNGSDGSELFAAILSATGTLDEIVDRGLGAAVHGLCA